MLASIGDSDCPKVPRNECPSLFQTSIAPCCKHQPGRQHENTWRRAQIACRTRTLERMCSSQQSAADRGLTLCVYACVLCRRVHTRQMLDHPNKLQSVVMNQQHGQVCVFCMFLLSCVLSPVVLRVFSPATPCSVGLKMSLLPNCLHVYVYI